MDDLVLVEVGQTTQNFPADVGDPFFLELLSFRRLDEVRDTAGTAVLHDELEKIIIFRLRYVNNEVLVL